jgi:hypothetical protein
VFFSVFILVLEKEQKKFKIFVKRIRTRRVFALSFEKMLKIFASTSFFKKYFIYLPIFLVLKI